MAVLEKKADKETHWNIAISKTLFIKIGTVFMRGILLLMIIKNIQRLRNLNFQPKIWIYYFFNHLFIYFNFEGLQPNPIKIWLNPIPQFSNFRWNWFNKLQEC